MAEPNIAAKLSEISAWRMRGSLPFLSNSPERWVTPISVPALSNTSIKNSVNTTTMKVSSKVRDQSKAKSVGEIEGGSETTPVNFAKPSGMPMSATISMPSSVAPGIFR